MDTTDTTSRSSVRWWVFLFAPAFLVSLYLAIWLQWLLPREDDFGFEYAPVVWILAGMFAGLAIPSVISPVTRRVIGVVAILVVAPWFLFPITFMLRQPWWLAGVAVCVAVAFGSYWLCHRIGRRFRGAWRLPLSAAALAIAASLTLFAAPVLDSFKWCWPYASFRSELRRFHDNAIAAGVRLGLPRNRELTANELAQLGRDVPLSIELRVPVINRTVVAKMRDLREGDQIWFYWGGGQFGPLHLRTMFIEWADN